MSGFKDFSIELRNRSSKFTGATADHVAISVFGNTVFITDSSDSDVNLQSNALILSGLSPSTSGSLLTYSETGEIVISSFDYETVSNQVNKNSSDISVLQSETQYLSGAIDSNSTLVSQNESSIQVLQSETQYLSGAIDAISTSITVPTSGDFVGGYDSRYVNKTGDTMTGSLSISSGNLTLANGTSINEFSTDTTMAGNSNDAVPTESAVVSYVTISINTTKLWRQVDHVSGTSSVSNLDWTALVLGSYDNYRFVGQVRPSASATLLLQLSPNSGGATFRTGGDYSYGHLTGSTSTFVDAPNGTSFVLSPTTGTGSSFDNLSFDIMIHNPLNSSSNTQINGIGSARNTTSGNDFLITCGTLDVAEINDGFRLLWSTGTFEFYDIFLYAC
jgi:hypothetical protein